jgi:hypothetical protein
MCGRMIIPPAALWLPELGVAEVLDARKSGLTRRRIPFVKGCVRT